MFYITLNVCHHQSLIFVGKYSLSTNIKVELNAWCLQTLFFFITSVFNIDSMTSQTVTNFKYTYDVLSSGYGTDACDLERLTQYGVLS